MITKINNQFIIGTRQTDYCTGLVRASTGSPPCACDTCNVLECESHRVTRCDRLQSHYTDTVAEGADEIACVSAPFASTNDSDRFSILL